MLTGLNPIIIVSLLLLPVAFLSLWLGVRLWYFQRVTNARNQIQNLEGKAVPGSAPRMLVGNLLEVYRAHNHLAAYHLFHQEFGEIVQIFWLWRQQLSISNYSMARRILVDNQYNYHKFPPNSLIQKLFGHSLLTNTGNEWKRHRSLLNEVFSKKQVINFHPIFVDYSQRLTKKWNRYITESGASATLNIYPELLALCLDIVGKVAIGKDFAALAGEADEFLSSLQYIVYQSTQPVHQFTTWWKYLPLPSNRKLNRAFQAIDTFLYQLIQQRKAQPDPDSTNVLDLLLQATDTSETELPTLTAQEVRDNLLAILANGHETVATSVSLSLYLLGQHPEKLAQAQAEVDTIMESAGGKLSEDGVAKLDYLHGVILETLRFSPPMAGLQRVSRDRDRLSGWSIPAQQVVGIALKPLHQDSQYFGEQPEQFHPERYLDDEPAPVPVRTMATSVPQPQCPFKQFLLHHHGDSTRKTKAGVYFPLTFGDGARKCLAEHFAMYEMKVTLAIMLYHFDFQIAPNFEAELELGKFGLFLTTFPKDGVEMLISPRPHSLSQSYD
jgi:cytochrome P450